MDKVFGKKKNRLLLIQLNENCVIGGCTATGWDKTIIMMNHDRHQIKMHFI